MTPADVAIEAFGSTTRVAEIVGIHRQTVWLWTQPIEAGGTGGVIPKSIYIDRLMQESAKLNKGLTIEKLIWGDKSVTFVKAGQRQRTWMDI